MVLLIRVWRSLDFYYTEKIDIFYLEMENLRTNIPHFYDSMILEKKRTRNITPPSYKLFNLEVDTNVSAFLVEKIIKCLTSGIIYGII